MVRGRVAQHSLGLQGTWRSYVHHGKMCDHELFEKAEAEFEKKFNERMNKIKEEDKGDKEKVELKKKLEEAEFENKFQKRLDDMKKQENKNKINKRRGN